MEQHGVLVGCVDRAGRAGRDVFVFCAYFCALWGVLRIVAHFSVDHGCLTSSEHPSKARITQTSLDLNNFLANTGHTPRVSNTSPTAAPQSYGCSPFFFSFGVLALNRVCENELGVRMY